VVVISPLVSLMKDQLIALDSFGVDCDYIGEKHDEGINTICKVVRHIAGGF